MFAHACRILSPVPVERLCYLFVLPQHVPHSRLALLGDLDLADSMSEVLQICNHSRLFNVKVCKDPPVCCTVYVHNGVGLLLSICTRKCATVQ